jgi:predicted TPR repeat methyltransferase
MESHHYDVLHRRLRTIVDLAESSGGRRLLDVGCSAGTVGAALSPGWAYHGCDISASAVRSATRGWLVAADLERGVPEFDGGSYDVIVCSGILEYLEHPEALLRALTRRIAPTGNLEVSYFNMRHVSRRDGAAFRHPLWRNDYAPAEFRALLQRAGWTIEATRWSTAGLAPAPDVRDEAAAVRNEPADAADRIDEIGHTLIYLCRRAE